MHGLDKGVALLDIGKEKGSTGNGTVLGKSAAACNYGNFSGLLSEGGKCFFREQRSAGIFGNSLGCSASLMEKKYFTEHRGRNGFLYDISTNGILIRASKSCFSAFWCYFFSYENVIIYEKES